MAIYFTQNTNSAEDIEQMNKVIDRMNEATANSTSNINQLTDLNTKAEELSNNIQQALPINTELKENIKIGQPLVQEATSKNTELQASLTETKEFIDGLDGSRNIPGIRMELTKLQNGLKTNQFLAYADQSSYSIENSLEGMTTDMCIKGRTLKNICKINEISTLETSITAIINTENQPKDNVFYFINNTDKTLLLNVYKLQGGWDSNPILSPSSIKRIDLTGKKATEILGMFDRGWTGSERDKELLKNTCIAFDKEETYIPSTYFEGIKSFGETEGNKISILSTGKNLVNDIKFEDNTLYYMDTGKKGTDSKYKAFSLKILPNKNYYFTINSTGINQIALYKNGVWKNGFYNNKSKLINGDYDEIKISVVKNGFISVQLEEGTVATQYEPYKCDKKDILIPFAGGLKSVGNLCDELVSNTKKAIERIGKRAYQAGDEALENVITDKTNTYYILDQAIEHDLSTDLEVNTYQDVTYVNIENSLPGTCSFKVPSNLASLVQMHSKEINEIWDVINKLLVPGLIDVNKKVALATIKNNLK